PIREIDVVGVIPRHYLRSPMEPRLTYPQYDATPRGDATQPGGARSLEGHRLPGLNGGDAAGQQGAAALFGEGLKQGFPYRQVFLGPIRAHLFPALNRNDDVASEWPWAFIKDSLYTLNPLPTAG